jgi:hypothetical protein
MSKITLFLAPISYFLPIFSPILDKKVVSGIGKSFKGKGESFNQYLSSIFLSNPLKSILLALFLSP